MPSYVWLVGGGIMQEPMLNEIHKRNLQAIVSDGNKNCYLVTKLYDTDIFLEVDTYNTKLHRQHANLFYEIKNPAKSRWVRLARDQQDGQLMKRTLFLCIGILL